MLTFEKKKLFKNFDFVLFFSVILLTLYGILCIYIATGYYSDSVQHIRLGMVKSQGAALILGVGAIIVLQFIDYELFGKLYIPIYVVSNILLLAVLLFGIEKNGAKSWISIAGVVIQPSEIVKIGIILSVSQYIKKNEETINYLFTLSKVLLFAGLPIGLVLLQGDFGTTIVFIFFTAAMLFIAGLDYKYIIYTLFAGLISLPLMWFFFFDEYQKNRIRVFLKPELDSRGIGWQVTNSKMAVGAGEKVGKIIEKYMGVYEGNIHAASGFLPFPQSDFIFPVISESFGFIGDLFLIFLYFIMLYRLVSISKRSKDMYGSLIVIGIAAMFVFHIIQNIGMTIGLMPVTGIPLPFISHGGTFLLSNMVSIGLALSIGTKKNRINF